MSLKIMSYPLDPLNLHSLLTPFGIEAVTNQSDDIQAFLKDWYGSDIYLDAYDALRSRILKIPSAKVCVIGYPCDNGAGLLRGSKFGPLALRSHLYQQNPNILSDWNDQGIIDIGDIFDHPLLIDDSMYEPWVLDHVRKARWNAPNSLPVSPLSGLKRVIELVYHLNPEIKVFILGGDHSLSFVPIEHLSIHQSLGVIHFDAHTDLLSVRQGLPYSYATWAWRANQSIGKGHRMLQVGIRETTKSQQDWEKSEEVVQIWAQEILDNEEKALENLCKKVENMPDKKAYLSFDIDVLSSEYVKATGTSSARGLTPQFIHKALDSIRGKINIIGADFVELAPSLCRGDFNEPQRSLDIACSITNQIISLLSN